MGQNELSYAEDTSPQHGCNSFTLPLPAFSEFQSYHRAFSEHCPWAGVDGSERIAEVAERLVSANGLGQSQGGPISIKQGRLEQLASLPAEKVLLVMHIGHVHAYIWTWAKSWLSQVYGVCCSLLRATAV